MLEARKNSKNTLDVPSYNEPPFYNARIGYNPSDAIFSPSKTSAAMAVPAVPLLPALLWGSLIPALTREMLDHCLASLSKQ